MGLRARLDAIATELESLPDDQAKARLFIHLARSAVQLAEQRLSDRAEIRRRAAQLYLAASQTATTARAERTRSFALGYLAELYETDGRLNEARTLTERAIFAAQSADAPDALYRWHWEMGRIEQAELRTEAALASYRQAL
jgi:hypothetical protein